MFRASSAHLQEDIVVRIQAAYGTVTLYKSPGGLSISSTWCSKHVEEKSILWIN